MGRRAVLAQSWRQQPESCEPRRNLRPRVASPNQWARMETLMRNRTAAGHGRVGSRPAGGEITAPVVTGVIAAR